MVPWRIGGGDWSGIGVLLIGLGGLVTGLNFYLSVVRYPWLRLRGHAPEEIEYISGLPLMRPR